MRREHTCRCRVCQIATPGCIRTVEVEVFDPIEAMHPIGVRAYDDWPYPGKVGVYGPYQVVNQAATSTIEDDVKDWEEQVADISLRGTVGGEIELEFCTLIDT